MKLYKVLDEYGRAYHGGKGKWPLPNGKPGAWLEVKGRLRPCHHGLHLCRRGDLLGWLGPAIYEAEYEGEKIIAADKLVVRKARLLRKLDGWNERTAQLFAADCAERALKHKHKAGRETDPRSWATIEAVRAYANGAIGAAALDPAWDAAKAAAWDAAEAAAWAAAAAYTSPSAAAERRWQIKRLFEYANAVRA